MFTCVDMMATPLVQLTERLERLRGSEAPCCVPEYEDLAARIQRASGFDRALRVHRALADDHRLLAAALLKRRGELCACEIQAATGLSHPTVSHHMRILAEAGLIRERRKGKWTFYRWNEPDREAVP